MAMDASKAAEQIGSWYASAPAIVVVSTAYDGPEAWIASGRCAVALMLESALFGVAHCTSAAPIEVPHLVPRLRAAVSTSNRPQMLLRLGVPVDADSAPQVRRLAVEQLLTRGSAEKPCSGC